MLSRACRKPTSFTLCNTRSSLTQEAPVRNRIRVKPKQWAVARALLYYPYETRD